jgi:hypothetical protein
MKKGEFTTNHTNHTNLEKGEISRKQKEIGREELI